MEQQKNGVKISIGASSILMIFVTLCLTTFAVLSYVTANADYKLTEKANTNLRLYYDADSKAQTVISQIDEALSVIKTACDNLSAEGISSVSALGLPEPVLDRIGNLLKEDRPDKQNQLYNLVLLYYDLKNAENISIDVEQSDAVSSVISFKLPINDKQSLSVSLNVKSSEYTITSYKTVSELIYVETPISMPTPPQ